MTQEVLRANILIVEDNVITRKMLRISLETEGYEVREADDGATALRLAEERAPDLVILDWRLPDLDGPEVARVLRAKNASLPIIAVTGWVQTEEAQLHSADFSDVLLKPVTPWRLVEVVKRHIAASLEATARGKTALVIDDDPTQRKLTRLVLESVGFSVAVAGEGEAGLALARAHKPDIVVSDVLMPGIDGFRVCQIARAEAALRDIPIVLTSAHYVEAEDQALALQFGATAYVSRAAGHDAILRVVVDALRTPSSASAPPSAEELHAPYLQRVAHQLSRQTALGTELARQASVQATALAVLERISGMLTRELNPESALTETLAQCLDAAGLSVGAILLKGDDGKLALRAHVGAAPTEVLVAEFDILNLALAADGISIPSAEAGAAGDEFLKRLGVDGALIVPICARDETLGALILASNRSELGGAESGSFVRAARAISLQLAQALLLSRTFGKLAAAEERYRTLFEHAHDAVGVLSTNGTFLEANRGWEEITRLPRASIVGRNVTDFVAGGGAGRERHDTLRRPDGSVVHLEVSRTKVAVANQDLVLIIARDVTERLLLAEQLRLAQKMEAVGRLAGGVAHDFNNILSVVLSYADLALASLPAADPVRDDLLEIRKAGQRAADFTGRLLGFSHHRTLHSVVQDLNEALTNMEKMLLRILGEDVELTSHQVGAPTPVRADPAAIEQVIMNLAINARDAMPQGGTLTMETKLVTLDDAGAQRLLGARAGKYVLLTVRDSGHGIDDATRARIFEPFFTTKDKGRGTGLGLATVFGIVQQCGGAIDVESEIGVGSAFHVYFPLADAALTETRPHTGSASLAGTETVLLVEDDDQVRAVSAGILRHHGYVVLQSRGPEEAIDLCENHTSEIDLLVTDIVMPKMNGVELARRLIVRRPKLKVLCVSGYAGDALINHGVDEESFAFLQKPITVEGLARKVREVLDRAT